MLDYLNRPLRPLSPIRLPAIALRGLSVDGAWLLDDLIAKAAWRRDKVHRKWGL